MTGETRDIFNFGRFVAAQADIHDTVLAELRQGQKRTHWMWFVFPQAEGLGHSAMARQFAIGSREETRAYLGHPILGKRLQECTQTILRHTGKTAHEIFGSPDDMKLHSSLTLFAELGDDPVFRQTLDAFYDSRIDQRSRQIVAGWP